MTPMVKLQMVTIYNQSTLSSIDFGGCKKFELYILNKNSYDTSSEIQLHQTSSKSILFETSTVYKQLFYNFVR
jgi:hypothetical protein